MIGDRPVWRRIARKFAAVNRNAHSARRSIIMQHDVMSRAIEKRCRYRVETRNAALRPDRKADSVPIDANLIGTWSGCDKAPSDGIG